MEGKEQSSRDVSGQFNSDIDINVIRITEKIEGDSDVLDEVRGKNCILLLGATGTGKTTTLNYLNGVSLTRSLLNLEQQVLEIAKGQLGCGDIGHDFKSQTKSITAYKLRSQEWGDEDFALVDSCGFEDTEGPEIDISNAVMLSNAMKTCSSLRPVVLINASLVDVKIGRGGLFKKQMQLITRFFSPISFFIEKMCFLFTHCDKHVTYQELKNRLHRCKNSEQICNDGALSTITEQIAYYLDLHKETVILRPEHMAPTDGTKSKHDDLLRIVLDGEPIQSELLSNLAFPLSGEAIAAIGKQCLHMNLAIKNALDLKPNSDFRTLLANLDSLHILKDCIDLDLVKEQYDLARNSVLQHLEGDPTRKEVPGLIKSTIKCLKEKNFSLLKTKLTNLDNAQCLRNYKADIAEIYIQIIKDVNDLICGISQPILLAADTEPSIGPSLNHLLAAKIELSEFLIPENKNAYDNVLYEVEKRAKERDILCQDGLKKFQEVFLGDVNTQGRSDFYLTPAEEMDGDKHALLFQTLCDHLEKQHALKRIESHINSEWLGYYAKCQASFCFILQQICDEALELATSIQNLTILPEKLSRLKHLHCLADKCLKGDTISSHLNTEGLFDFHKAIVDKVTEALHKLYFELESHMHSPKREFEKAYMPLLIIQNTFLNEEAFSDFQSDIALRAAKMTHAKLQLIFRECMQHQDMLSSRDYAQKSDYEPVAAAISCLQQACCLEPLLFSLHSQFQNVVGSQTFVGGDFAVSVSCFCSEIENKAKHDWETRFSELQYLISISTTTNNPPCPPQAATSLSITEDLNCDSKSLFVLLQKKFIRFDSMAPLMHVLKNTPEYLSVLKSEIEKVVATVLSVDFSIDAHVMDMTMLKCFFDGIFGWIQFIPIVKGSVLFKIVTADTDAGWVARWTDQLGRELVTKKDIAVQATSQHLLNAAKLSKDAIDEFNSLLVKQNLDILRSACILDDFLEPKPSMLYISSKNARRNDITRICRETELAVAANAEDGLHLEQITKAKLFFESASAFQDHFEDLDFVTMSSTLQSKYRDVLLQIPKEISELLSNYDFDAIKVKIKSVDGRELQDGNWGAQDKEIFKVCNALLCNFFKNFKTEIMNLQSRSYLTSSDLGFVKAKLDVADKFMAVRGLTNKDSDPLDLVLLLYRICVKFYEKLLHRMKRFLTRHNFMLASADYNVLTQFDDMDTAFESHLASVFCQEEPATSLGQSPGGSELCDQSPSALSLFSDRNMELRETEIDTLSGNIVKECQSMLTNGANEQSFPMSAALFIDPIAIKKLRALLRGINEVVKSNDPDSLFQGTVLFDDIKEKIETLVLRTSKELISNLKHSIADLKFEQASELLESLGGLASIIAEIDAYQGQVISDKIRDQQEALLFAIANSEAVVTAELFSFSTDQIPKLRTHLETLRLENMKKFVDSKTKLREKFQTEAKHLNLTSSCQSSIYNFDFDSVQHIFEFMDCLQLFEDEIAFSANDQASKKLSQSCKKNFTQLLHELLLLFKSRLKEGKNIESGKEDLLNFKNLAQHSLQFAKGSVQEFLSYLCNDCVLLLKSFEDQISLIKSAEEQIKEYDLFEVINIELLIENLKILELQSDVTRRKLGSENNGETGLNVILTKLETQLKCAFTKAEALLKCLDYSTVATILSNIQKLQKFERVREECEKASQEIQDLVFQKHTSIRKQFIEMFTERKFVEIDAIIQDASKVDKAFAEKISVFEPLMESVIVSFQKELEQFIPSRGKAKELNVADHAYIIHELKSFVTDISNIQIHEIVDARVNSYLRELASRNLDFFELGVLLVSYGPLGEQITERYPQFQAVKTKRLNETFKSAGITIDHALFSLKDGQFPVSEKEIKALKSLYTHYENNSNQLLQQYLPGFSGFGSAYPLNRLVNEIKSRAKTVMHRATRENLLQLLAGIFAVWTVQTSQHMFEARGGDKDCLIRPNVVQLLAIFRLLGLDNTSTGFWCALQAIGSSLGFSNTVEFDGHVIQVGTGEGKSILLGGLSCLLALVGFKVYCASYSKHLSKRDYDSFLPLFELLGVADAINYSTLSGLAEAVINSRGDVRDLALSHVRNGSSNCVTVPQNPQPSILIIDEVDVFFSEDFLGVTYDPVAKYCSEETKAILEHVWTFRATQPSLKNIQELPAYNVLVANFKPEAKPLLDQQIRLMLQDVENFNDPPYEIVTCAGGGKKIGYKEMDSVNTSIVYGYKTAFAYLYEAQRHPAIKDHVAGMLAFSIPCGSFSYAEIPRAHFQTIMGVTGTLTCLSTAEAKVIQEDYKISKKTVMPSIYGDSKRKFQYKDVDVVVEFDLQRYHQSIMKEIIDERNKNRAILVFFETEKKIDDFIASSYGGQLQDITIVTEKIENIPFYVDKATESKKVTFFPKVFGRGLDFVSREKQVNDAGGVHVIQTFYSEYQSEEIQIMGRTARQAKEGSFKLILFQGDLEKFDVSEEVLKQVYPSATFYEEFLKGKRELKAARNMAERQEVVEQAKFKHKKAMKFVAKMLERSPRTKDIVDIMLSFTPNVVKKTHIVFCLDESGSMELDWDSLVSAFSEFLQLRADLGASDDVVSVVQFSNSARVTMDRMPLLDAMNNTHVLTFKDGGTLFVPALQSASRQLQIGPVGADAVVVFMTDGECSDKETSPPATATLRDSYTQGLLMFFGVSFRESVDTLKRMTAQVPNGILLPASNVIQLRDQFQHIARTTATAQRVRN